MADETPKVEPILIVKDSPSIAASDQAPVDAPKPEIAEIANVEATEAKIEPKIEPKAEKAEPKVEPKIEPKIEAPTLPPAPQLTEPPAAIVPFKDPKPKAEAAAPQASRARFALLAACVAIAASFGAIGGSLAVAKFGPTLASAPPPAAPAPITRDQVADEVKALKDTLA